MIEFEIAGFSALLVDLARLREVYEEFQGPMDHEHVENLASIVGALSDLCSDAGFKNAFDTIATTIRWGGSGNCKYEANQSEITHVIEAMQSELMARRFFHLAPEQAKYFNRSKPFGDSVDTAFPSARSDIREAANCIATDRSTAAVFHLMRTVEWGLRALCAEVGLRQVAQKKSGSHIPLRWAEWGTLLEQLHSRVDERLNRLKRGHLKQSEQQFYYPVLQDIRGIRDAWRNHVMHTRADYSWVESTAIFEHVRRIMTTIAARLAKAAVIKRPKIHLAQYGYGESNYLDVTETLVGFLTSNIEVLASNHFFSDPYPNKEKHLIVRYSAPGSRAVKTARFAEGQKVTFTK
jgi:hypothetical protein